LLEAVIGLPAGLVYGTGIPARLLILNKRKPAEHKRKVLFINGELRFAEGKNQNTLRAQDSEKILAALEHFAAIMRYAKDVTLGEIAEDDYNLNIRRYARRVSGKATAISEAELCTTKCQ
jgi:type I restriction enzyme M protein